MQAIVYSEWVSLTFLWALGASWDWGGYILLCQTVQSWRKGWWRDWREDRIYHGMKIPLNSISQSPLLQVSLCMLLCYFIEGVFKHGWVEYKCDPYISVWMQIKCDNCYWLSFRIYNTPCDHLCSGMGFFCVFHPRNSGFWTQHSHSFIMDIPVFRFPHPSHPCYSWLNPVQSSLSYSVCQTCT